MRNPLAHVAKNEKEMVAATVRTIFAQPDPEATRAHLRTVADTLQPRFPKVAELLLAAETDVTGYADFPGGPGRTTSPQKFAEIMDSLEGRLFVLPDDTWVYPGQGDDTTLGTERQSLGEWAARGW